MLIVVSDSEGISQYAYLLCTWVLEDLWMSSVAAQQTFQFKVHVVTRMLKILQY